MKSLKRTLFIGQCIAKIRIITFLQKIGILPLLWRKSRYCKTRHGYLYLSPEYNLSSWFRRFGCWEPHVCYALPKEIKPGDKVLELGSCFGYFSIMLADLVGEKGKVVGLEPCQNYFAFLQKTRQINPRFGDRIQFLNMAVGETNNTFHFDATTTHYEMLSQLNSLDYTPAGHLSKNSEGMEMKMSPLQDVLALIGFTPDVIFMDIEGAELTVFEQIMQLGIKPKVIFEHHKGFYGEEKFSNTMRKLKDYGYQERWTDPDHLVLAPMVV